MSEQQTHNDSESEETATPKRRAARSWTGREMRRHRSRGGLPGSPPGAGGRLLDLYFPRF